MENPHWKNLKNLIVVAGHAVYIAQDFRHPDEDVCWYLQPFQKGEPPFYLEHIRVGVDLAESDRNSLLVYSGGQTRYEAGPRSEAQSYWLLADSFKWWSRTNVRLRAVTEEFARDSFENLLFSICRFRECVGIYPAKVTVVSWEFKRERFELHRSALRWNKSERYAFVGANNPVDLVGALRGERDNALEPFKSDPYGTGVRPREIPQANGPAKIVNLGNKRSERDPFQRTPPYELTCRDLSALLRHQGPGIYDEDLPVAWAAA
jgi:hypothetical protein